MQPDAAQLARRLSAHVEAVCEHYLCNGTKAGRYWLVGDVMNTPGQSLHVRLTGPAYGPGAAGKWVDEATGEFGDLLDLIRINRKLDYFPALREEVLRFLSEPAHLTRPVRDKVPKNSREAASRLFAASKPIAGTLADDYFRSRGLILPPFNDTLRFHPSCYYRPYPQSELQRWPALIAAITDDNGNITGVLRTFLMRDGTGKAPLEHPRMVMADILGNAIRLGRAEDALIAGEGLETMASIKMALPFMPVAAALTANHLAALEMPARLKRLYIALDRDKAGFGAARKLAARARAADILVRSLMPRDDDWNRDLRDRGLEQVRARLLPRLMPDDRSIAEQHILTSAA